MSQIFGNLKSDNLEESEDRLGGFKVHESNAYTGKIKAAYAGKAASSNAQNVTIILDTADGEYRETFWITNKQGENFYTDKNDTTKRRPLPGFTIVEDICLVTTNKTLSDQSAVDKVMNVYDVEAKSEIPKSVPMLVELLGKEVTFGILKEIKNKQAKDGNGVYQDTDETREENVTDKIFHYPSNLTVVEARKQVQTPAFYDAWVKKNAGVTRDRRSNKGGQTGTAGSPPKASGGAAPKTPSLFG